MPILAIYRWYCISLLHVTEIIYLTNEIVVSLQKEYPAWNRTSGHQKNKKILYLLFDFRFNYAVSHGFTFTFKASLSLSLISGSLPASASDARLLVESKIQLLRAWL